MVKQMYSQTGNIASQVHASQVRAVLDSSGDFRVASESLNTAGKGKVELCTMFRGSEWLLPAEFASQVGYV